MIALLIAASALSAPSRPALFTATMTGHYSAHMGSRGYVSVISRGSAGRPIWRPSWLDPSSFSGFRSFTLTVSGQDYTMTVPALRWAIIEAIGSSASVRYRVERGEMDWTGHFWTEDSLVLMPGARMSGSAVATFRASKHGTVVNAWWGD